MSPIAQMKRLHHPIHAGFGRHLEGARAFHFKSLLICVIGVIGGFNSFFRMHAVHPGHPVQNPEPSFPSGAVSSVAPNTFGQPGETGRMLRVDPIPGPR
jgi:hypothetical protein